MRKIVLTAIVSSLSTLALVQLFGAPATVTRDTVLENARVRVIERSIPAGAERTPYTRPTDQVIVFLNDVSYDRIDSQTGEKISRTRRGGEVIWHDQGESAPKLVNTTKGDFRSLIIELK